MMGDDRRRAKERLWLLLFGVFLCACGSSERTAGERSAGSSTGGTAGGGTGGAPAECPPIPEDPIAGTAGVFDASGCDLVGSVVLPGAPDAAGTDAVVNELGRTGMTTADGRFELDDVPVGLHRLRFRNGDYRETMPSVICATDGSVLVDDALLADSPLELFRGARISDGERVPVAPDPRDRVYFDSGPGRTYVVDRSCSPPMILDDCAFMGASEHGEVVSCLTSNSFNVRYVAPNPASFDSLVQTAANVALARNGHYVAYAASGTPPKLHLLEVTTREDRLLGTLWRQTMARFTSDDTHLVFVDDTLKLLIAESATGAVTTIDTLSSMGFTNGGPYDEFLFSSPDGQHLAYWQPGCVQSCELRLTGMTGPTRSLDAAWTPAGVHFSPDSRYLLVSRSTSTSIGGMHSISLVDGADHAFAVAGNFEPTFVGGGNVMFPFGSSPVQVAIASTASGELLATTPGERVLSVSPNGRWVLVQMPYETGLAVTEPIALFDTERRGAVVLDSEYTDGGLTVMSPDSSTAVFPTGSTSLVLKRIDFVTGSIDTLGTVRDKNPHVLYSPDGAWVAFNDDTALSVARNPRGAATLLSNRYAMSASALSNALSWLGSAALVTKLFGLPPYAFQEGVYVLIP